MIVASHPPRGRLVDLLAHLQAALADRYTIEHELGHGGMATVYLAHDLKHDRAVALKVLSSELAMAVGSERFLREIKIAARLEHPHILPLHDSGDADGFLYYVMPYVAGASLRARLQHEPQLPLADALRISREVAQALDYAHRHGVVHRDIKPENVLLADGQAVVADFGIARLLAATGRDALTESGLAVGTPAYMSPEQATGDTQIDGRSDIYSLGCVLFEMLAGEPPFTGRTAQAIIAKRLSGPIPHLQPLRDVPEPIDRAVRKALAKAPADRWASGAEFAAALTESAPKRPSLQVTLIVLLAAIGAGAALLFGRFRTSAPAASGPSSVGVLYLDNLSRDTADAYLADGLTEEITARLGDVPRLQVKSRNSVRRVQNAALGDLVAIGRELGVRYLVEGSLQRVATHVRVAVRLIRSEDGFRVWGQEYDRPTTDLLALEQDVASAVATAIAGHLLPSERASLTLRPTQDLVAYDHFLRGNYYLARVTPRATERAIEEYSVAVGIDSDFVQPLFGLAEGYSLISLYGWQYRGFAPEGVLALGVAATDRALRKDSMSADAWVARSVFLEALHPQTLEGVLEAIRRAMSADPRSAKAYRSYGYTLAKRGDDSGGVAALRHALSLDQDQPAVLTWLGAITFREGRIKEAIRWDDSALTIDPGFHNAVAARGNYRLYAGDTAGARADAETALRLRTGDALWGEALLAMVKAREGDTSGARALIGRLLQRPDLRRPSPSQGTWVASALVALRENATALSLIERAPRSAWLAWWLQSPHLDPLRSDLRFKRIIAESRPPGRAAR